MDSWLHLDKTSGVGPSKVNVTVDGNETGDVREYTIKVTKLGSNPEAKTCLVKQESVPVVVIPEFDFLALRYIWGDNDGIDFDTATGFDNTGLQDVDGKLVGWSKQYQTTYERVGDYLIHGGDNMESGNEAALIQMEPLLGGGNFDKLPTEIRASIYGNWYGGRGVGDVTIRFTAYKGGTMEKRGFDFINVGGEEVYTGDAKTNITADGTTNWEDIKSRYSKVGTMIYNKESRDCIVRIGQ